MKAYAALAAIVCCSVVSAQSTGATSPPRQLVDALKIIGDGSRSVFVDVAVGPTRGYTPGPSVGLTPIPFFFGPREYSYLATGRFLNLSVRAFVTPEQSVIAGLVVGEGGRVVLVRAVGPSLASFGVTGVLSRPQLQMLDSTGGRIASAIAWSSNDSAIVEEFRKAAGHVGAFALREGSEDQVLMVVLGAGSYTCVVTGQANSTGIVLLEAYEMPR